MFIFFELRTLNLEPRTLLLFLSILVSQYLYKVISPLIGICNNSLTFSVG